VLVWDDDAVVLTLLDAVELPDCDIEVLTDEVAVALIVVDTVELAVDV
jgi:hypothetical protein